MEIQFFAQKIVLNPEARDYVTEKINKIVKQAGYSAADIRGIHVDVSRNATHDSGEIIRLEINLDFLRGQKVLQAVDRAETVQKAADLVEKELLRQLRKMKTAKKAKRLKGGRKMKEMIEGAGEEEGEEGGE